MRSVMCDKLLVIVIITVNENFLYTLTLVADPCFLHSCTFAGRMGQTVTSS